MKEIKIGKHLLKQEFISKSRILVKQEIIDTQI